MAAKSYDYLYKIILIGEPGTDKVGLMHTFCPRPYFIPTIGVDFLIRTIELDSKRIKLQIWDTAGSERFGSMTHSYFRGTSGVMLVYDVTNRKSFESVVGRFKRDVQDRKAADAVVMLLGNKCHKEDARQVSVEEGRQVAQESGYLFFEASSETGANVEPALVTLAQAIKDRANSEAA